MLLTECRIQITSFGAESCEGVMATFVKTCRLAASEECTSTRCYEGLSDRRDSNQECTSTRCYEGLSDRRDSNQESSGKETTSTVDAERTWSLKANSCSYDHDVRKRRLNVQSGSLVM